MRNFTLPAIFFLCTSVSALSAQQKTADQYLLVRITDAYDALNTRAFYYILPEKGADSAVGIYDLKKYASKKGEAPPAGHFYFERPDNSNDLFNYFVSPTEALNYIASQGWKLWLVYPETGSGTTNERAGNGDLVPVTTISSRPVYCFVRSH